jgi:hypothetical protein
MEAGKIRPLCSTNIALFMEAGKIQPLCSTNIALFMEPFDTTASGRTAASASGNSVSRDHFRLTKPFRSEVCDDLDSRQK